MRKLAVLVLALALVPLASLWLSCGDDGPSKPKEGEALLQLGLATRTLPDGRELPLPDSVQVELRDSGGAARATAVASWPSGAETMAISIAVEPGEGMQAHALAIGGLDYGGGSAGLYYGGVSGLSIDAGGTTQAALALAPAVVPQPAVDILYGESSYTIRWRRVQGASEYAVREFQGASFTDTAVGDTLLALELGRPAGFSRLLGAGPLHPRLAAGARAVTRGGSSEADGAGAGAEIAGMADGAAANFRAYRVRARLPLGWGGFSDSTRIDLDFPLDLPRVFSVTPADGETGVADTVRIRVRFDRPMDAGSLASAILLRHEGAAVPAEVVSIEPGDEARVDPEEPLLRGETYRLEVTSEARDSQGRPIDQDPQAAGLQGFFSEFSVESYDPLRVVSSRPSPGDTIAVTASPRVRFQRAIRPETLDGDSFRLLRGEEPVAAEIHALSDVDYEIDPVDALVYGGVYTVRVETSVLDLQRGEPLDQDPLVPGLQPFVLGFRSEAQPRGPRVDQTTPVCDEENGSVDENRISVEFDRAVDPATLDRGLRFFRNLNGTWFQITGTKALSNGGLLATFAPTTPLERDRLYKIEAISGPEGIYDVTGIPFDQDPYEAGYQDFTCTFRTEQNVRVEAIDPPAEANGVDPRPDVTVTFSLPVVPSSVNETSVGLFGTNGLRVADSLWVSSDSLRATLRPRAPLQNYEYYTLRAGYGIVTPRGGEFDQDWNTAGHQGFTSRFRTIHETVAPFVASSVPDSGAAGVSVGSQVRVVFSEPVREELLEAYFYVTQGSTGPKVSGATALSADQITASFTPSSPLAYDATYCIHVDILLTDLFGNGIDQDPDTPGKQPFFACFTTQPEQQRPQVVSVTPLDGAREVDVAPEILLDFSESMDTASVRTAFRVETGGAAHEGSLLFSNSQRHLRWTPREHLLYGTLYRVVVDTTAVDLAGNPLDQDPGGAPNPFDSVFWTEGDSIAPRLLSTDPADGATAVAVTVSPLLVWDEPLDPASVTPESVALRDSLGAAVPAARELSPDGRQVTIVPDDSLAYETLYTIVVTPAVTDTAGNAFDADPDSLGGQSFAASFRTDRERIAPRVLRMTLDGDPPPVDTGIRIDFSEPVDSASALAPEHFRLMSEADTLEGSRLFTADHRSVILDPADDLEYQTTYSVIVEGVVDEKGNLLDQDPDLPGEQPFSDTFTTAPPPIAPPHVMSVSPASGSLDQHPSEMRITFSVPMDPSTFTPSNPAVLHDGAHVGEIATADSITWTFTPADSLHNGVYIWTAQTSLKDIYGRSLDQDAESPGLQPYSGWFEVGKRPVVTLQGLCIDADSAAVELSGTAEGGEPDVAIAGVQWIWEDGLPPEEGDLPAGGVVTREHLYDCVGIAGCDGFDNDGDGLADGDDPECNESFRVILQVVDEFGLSAADTAGVSFCGFRVASSSPADGATDVDTTAAITVLLTRACNPASADTSVFLKLGADTIDAAISVDPEAREITLDPSADLLPDTVYTIEVTSGLIAATGGPLDQACEPGAQGYLAAFRTLGRRGKDVAFPPLDDHLPGGDRLSLDPPLRR